MIGVWCYWNFIIIITGKSQKKKTAVLDSDEDDNSSVSSTSTMRSDKMSVLGTEEVQINKDSLLDLALDALYEKKRYKFGSN